MNDYKKEYLDTCDEINKMIIAKWPNVGADGGSPLSWAKDNAPDLYKQEEKLDARINVMWINALDFADFQKTVIEWARTILKIYKKFSEAIAEPVGANGRSPT